MARKDTLGPAFARWWRACQPAARGDTPTSPSSVPGSDAAPSEARSSRSSELSPPQPCERACGASLPLVASPCRACRGSLPVAGSVAPAPSPCSALAASPSARAPAGAAAVEGAAARLAEAAAEGSPAAGGEAGGPPAPPLGEVPALPQAAGARSGAQAGAAAEAQEARGAPAEEAPEGARQGTPQESGRSCASAGPGGWSPVTPGAGAPSQARAVPGRRSAEEQQQAAAAIFAATPLDRQFALDTPGASTDEVLCASLENEYEAIGVLAAARLLYDTGAGGRPARTPSPESERGAPRAGGEPRPPEGFGPADESSQPSLQQEQPECGADSSWSAVAVPAGNPVESVGLDAGDDACRMCACGVGADGVAERLDRLERFVAQSAQEHGELVETLADSHGRREQRHAESERRVDCIEKLIVDAADERTDVLTTVDATHQRLNARLEELARCLRAEKELHGEQHAGTEASLRFLEGLISENADRHEKRVLELQDAQAKEEERGAELGERLGSVEERMSSAAERRAADLEEAAEEQRRTAAALEELREQLAGERAAGDGWREASERRLGAMERLVGDFVSQHTEGLDALVASHHQLKTELLEKKRRPAARKEEEQATSGATSIGNQQLLDFVQTKSEGSRAPEGARSGLVDMLKLLGRQQSCSAGSHAEHAAQGSRVDEKGRAARSCLKAGTGGEHQRQLMQMQGEPKRVSAPSTVPLGHVKSEIIRRVQPSLPCANYLELRGALCDLCVKVRVAQKFAPTLIAMCDDGDAELLSIVERFGEQFQHAVDLLAREGLLGVAHSPHASAAETAAWELLAKRIVAGSQEAPRPSGAFASELREMAQLAGRDLDQAREHFKAQLARSRQDERLSSTASRLLLARQRSGTPAGAPPVPVARVPTQLRAVSASRSSPSQPRCGGHVSAMRLPAQSCAPQPPFLAVQPPAAPACADVPLLRRSPSCPMVGVQRPPLSARPAAAAHPAAARGGALPWRTASPLRVVDGRSALRYPAGGVLEQHWRAPVRSRGPQR